MNVSRFVCLAVAIIVTAIQWAAVFGPVHYTQSVQAIDGVVAGAAPNGSLPVVVVVAHR